MDFAFSEEQEELSGLCRQILGDLVTHERLKELEASDDRFDRDVWGKLAEANLLGIGVPEADGGMGLGLVELALLFHAVGTTLPYVPALGTLSVAWVLGESGNEAQRSVLGGVVSGETVLASALAEAANYDPANPATTARRDGETWVLDGEKICVAYAADAAKIAVSARTPDGGGALFIVDRDADGLTLEPLRVTNREPQSALGLDGVVVGSDALVGPPDGSVLRRLVDVQTAMICAMELGIAEKAMSIAAEYGRERKQFEVPIGSFQAFHQRIADSYIEVLGIRLTAWQAIWRLGEGLDAIDELAIAKAWASEHAYSVAAAAVHLHGGMGVDVDYPLHRYYLWARELELRNGSAAVQYAALGERMASAPV